MVPRTDPLTLERVPAARGRYDTSYSAEPPAGAGRLAEQLEGVPEAPVPYVEREQVGAPTDPHGREVVRREAGGTPQPGDDDRVADPGVPRPDAPSDRTAATQGQVDVPVH